MKIYLLSALTILMTTAAIVPAAQALPRNSQASTPSEVSEDATLHDLIRHNRRVRNKG